ncbi:UvrD-helicase domain-containing protein [Clostridium botulinum]|uniref:UvrD-helicase domain-containing protein n=1 Tax=Clostridium botulinum TaxID=1491 RepID=UPI003DA1CE82
MIITAETNLEINQDFKIEAGPGAGKTKWLVNHINNVLQNSDRLSCVRKIACITYTNTAVETILKRLGKGASNKVEVSTIHSFLYNNVVKPYCSFLSDEYNVCSSKVKGHDEPFVNPKIVSQWLEIGKFDALKHPNSKKQLLKLPVQKKALSNWLLTIRCNLDSDNIYFKGDSTKANAYDKTKKRIAIKSSNLDILQDGLLEYKKMYWKNGKLDHEDILFFSYILIKENPFILAVLRAKFPYFYIDEFQDTNPIQSFILDEIRKTESNIGVIGDKAQAIYGFQGADVHQFTNFQIEPLNLHTIIENHRSSNQIIKFLNSIRKDIEQDSCENVDDINVTLIIGDRNLAYSKAKQMCNNEVLVSLSRDNVTSNAMKVVVEDNNLDKKFLENYSEYDSNNDRRNHISSFIQAVELAENSRYKEAIKKIEWIYGKKSNSQKQALSNLAILLKKYDEYSNGTLMDFYNILCNSLNFSLSKFKGGSIKEFYENTLYRKMAICVNIIEDTSNHITIHKSKGAEYGNVFVVGNQDMLNLLLKSDLENNEEHRVFYVAVSRAKKKLFIQLENLKDIDEKKLTDKYVITLNRI